MKMDLSLLLAHYSNLGNPDGACYKLSELPIPSTPEENLGPEGQVGQ